MASESSSAVLELNDADAEDTDAPSVLDDAPDGAPLIMDHGYDIAVKVDAPMKQLSTLETFVTYRVRCVCARWPTPPYVRRRYNHFKALHRRLSLSHPALAPPPLPPLHSARQQLDRYAPGFVAVRTLGLHLFLDYVARHPILTHSEDFRLFLTTPDDELEKIFKNENTAMNLWGLSSALYGNNTEAKPTNGARVKDPEFTAAAEYLNSLQLKLSALCSLCTKLHKGSSALGTELTGMSRVCSVWSLGASGLVGRAVSGCGAGAGGAGAARGGRGGALRAQAALPLMAAYAQAHGRVIRQRDTLHAASVAANNSGELHNKLEQASEAIRSELSDWLPKSKADLKSILLELAERQVGIYTQTVMSWEHALKLSAETNVDELFKTVSKSAVQNLSPSKSKIVTPTETERDFDDFSNDESEIGARLESDSFERFDRPFEFDDKTEFEKVDLEKDTATEKADLEKDTVTEKADLEKDAVIEKAETDASCSKPEGPESTSSIQDKLKLELRDPLQDFSDVDLSS